MENPVMILGATRLGKIALDIFNSRGIVIYCFLDDDATLHNQEIGEVPVMGAMRDDGFLKFIGKKCEVFVAAEDQKTRKELVEMLKIRRKVMPVNAVHDRAYLAQTAYLGYGNLIAAGAVVNSYAKIENHCVVGINASIDCEATVADFVQIGAGATIGAKASIGAGAIIGAGAVIATGIKIGVDAQVAPGAVVLKDVAKGSIVFGNPAQSS